MPLTGAQGGTMLAETWALSGNSRFVAANAMSAVWRRCSTSSDTAAGDTRVVRQNLVLHDI